MEQVNPSSDEKSAKTEQERDTFACNRAVIEGAVLLSPPASIDQMCGGGFFRDSVTLVSGATGTGKALLV
jgi:predicted ATP-dependent serine protease